METSIGHARCTHAWCEANVARCSREGPPCGCGRSSFGCGCCRSTALTQVQLEPLRTAVLRVAAKSVTAGKAVTAQGALVIARLEMHLGQVRYDVGGECGEENLRYPHDGPSRSCVETSCCMASCPPSEDTGAGTCGPGCASPCGSSSCSCA